MLSQEKRNRNIGLVTSAGVHLTLLLLFLFLVAWRAPNPPLPEFGIELNFGVDDQGSGEVQPDTPPSSEATENEESEPVSAEELSPETAAEPVVESQQESVVPLKEEKPKEVVGKPKETDKPKEEVKKEEPIKAEYKPEASTDTKKTTDSKVSQGDDKNKTGDKGNPEGSLDAKALYGKQGGGGGGDGLSLQMSGWAWADQPSIPNVPDNEDGRIVFEIECDSEGDIIGIITKERGLSPKAEQLLKEEIRKNSLIRTSAGATPERSKGLVVFVLKTK
jgi:periplasmic protein TonB